MYGMGLVALCPGQPTNYVIVDETFNSRDNNQQMDSTDVSRKEMKYCAPQTTLKAVDYASALNGLRYAAFR